MNVTFVKTGARRYGVHVERERAPALWIGTAPGYDDHLPHDLLHFVFGHLAAGGNALPVGGKLTLQWPRPEGRKRQPAQQRRKPPATARR